MSLPLYWAFPVSREHHMPVSPVLAARARTGVAARSGDEDQIEDARRDLAAAKLEQYIEKIVSTAPPLSPAQNSHLAALFGGGA